MQISKCASAPTKNTTSASSVDDDHHEWRMYAYGLCVCIWSDVAMCMHHLAGQKFLDILVALLLPKWTSADPMWTGGSKY